MICSCKSILKMYCQELVVLLLVLLCLSRELDKTASNVSDAVLPLSLGNLGLLIADPTIDKSSLHSQIIHTYKWSARVSSLL